MKTKLIILLGGILFCTTGCKFLPTIKGDGNVVTQTIDISNYKKIQLATPNATFNYSQLPESSPTLTVTVDQNIYDLFEFKTEGDYLIIRTKENNLKKRLRPTEFTITSNSTELRYVSMAAVKEFNINTCLVSNEKVKIDLAGRGIINMNDTVRVDELEINLAGNATINSPLSYIRKFEGNIAGSGTINLAGKGEKAAFNIAGSGKIHTFDFEVAETSFDIAGKGTLETFTTDRIKASIAGIGNIHYKGNPSISRDKAGLGNVRKVD